MICTQALCFGSALPRGYAEGGDAYLAYAWNGAANLEAYGWSEFFEFDVEEEIYVSRVEFGENRGAGAVVACIDATWAATSASSSASSAGAPSSAMALGSVCVGAASLSGPSMMLARCASGAASQRPRSSIGGKQELACSTKKLKFWPRAAAPPRP